MLGFIARRLAQSVPTVFAIVTVTFFLVTMIPGDPAQILAGSAGATPEYYAMMREKLGLDRPLAVRYANYLGQVAQGNLGYSLASHEPVMALILSRLPATLLLGVASLVVATGVGLLLGVVQGVFVGTPVDRIGQVLAVSAYSVPLFWLGQIGLLIFALQLGWFPVGGIRDARQPATGFADLADVARHLVLPAVTLGMYSMAIIARLTRARIVEIVRDDYVRTAHAKGLRPARVLFVHVLRNAVLPVVTVTGMSLGFLVASSLIVETVFSWPGTGRLMYDSLLARDYPVLMGAFIILSTMVVVVNIATDVVIAYLDPRIRLQ
jgi:peptide/nickel transport system permease protein